MPMMMAKLLRSSFYYSDQLGPITNAQQFKVDKKVPYYELNEVYLAVGTVPPQLLTIN
jgi:hypothetical protein